MTQKSLMQNQINPQRGQTQRSARGSSHASVSPPRKAWFSCKAPPEEALCTEQEKALQRQITVLRAQLKEKTAEAQRLSEKVSQMRKVVLAENLAGISNFYRFSHSTNAVSAPSSPSPPLDSQQKYFEVLSESQRDNLSHNIAILTEDCKTSSDTISAFKRNSASIDPPHKRRGPLGLFSLTDLVFFLQDWNHRLLDKVAGLTDSLVDADAERAALKGFFVAEYSSTPEIDTEKLRLQQEDVSQSLRNTIKLLASKAKEAVSKLAAYESGSILGQDKTERFQRANSVPHVRQGSPSVERGWLSARDLLTSSEGCVQSCLTSRNTPSRTVKSEKKRNSAPCLRKEEMSSGVATKKKKKIHPLDIFCQTQGLRSS